MTAHWDGTINFSAYDQVETFENYRTSAEIEAYRSERLAFCANRARFIAQMGDCILPGDVIEIGAGSSALLYAMDQLGALRTGTAIELSASRHRFAERWKQENNFHRVKNLCGDFATAEVGQRLFDLFLCVDNTFSYIGPENPAYPKKLVEIAFSSLRPGGSIIIETLNQEKVLAAMHQDERQLWRELPETNAFRFALYRQTFNRSANLIRSESIYLGRDGVERRKTEIETAHTQATLTALLTEAGFNRLEFFGDYGCSAFDHARSDYLIVCARKPAA